MSELNDEILDEIDDGSVEDVTEDDIRDSLVITVPLDSTLTINGAAADARATGQAIAAKASEADVKSQLSVNGRTGGGGWAIMVNGDNIPAQSDSDSESVAEALDRIGTALATETAARTSAIENVSGDTIPVSSDDSTKVKAYIDAGDNSVRSDVSTLALHGMIANVFSFTEPGTKGTNNPTYTENHVLIGYQFYDQNNSPTSDVLADFTWSTLDGGMRVVIDRVYAPGKVEVVFGWRQVISPNEDI